MIHSRALVIRWSAHESACATVVHHDLGMFLVLIAAHGDASSILVFLILEQFLRIALSHGKITALCKIAIWIPYDCRLTRLIIDEIIIGITCHPADKCRILVLHLAGYAANRACSWIQNDD